MSGNPAIAASGSSSYGSNTLHVGDGTWDALRDDFLLPPLVGLNFATMQYNGMGNRFRGLLEYHKLILGHGVLAAITFLFIVPAAIFIPRFYWRSPLYAMKLHIWLQILTVLLTTVILTLGWFSVGPNRSLSNPHHGIGIAIYVLILFQAMWGWLVRKLERGRTIWRVSVKLMLHQWIGRATALLAIAQIALGLTLYGSPKVLFILYALWVFILLVAWFVLSHRYQRGGGGEDSSSYFTDGRTDITAEHRTQHRGRGILGALAATGIAAAALNALGRRRSQRTAQSEHVTEFTEGSHHSHHSHPDSRYSHTASVSSFTDEKINEHERKHTWRNRLLAGAGLAAAAGLARNFFRGRRQEENLSTGSFSQVSGPSYTASHTDLSRVEEGRPPLTSTTERIRRTDHTSEVPVSVASPSRRSRLRRSGASIVSEETQSFASPGRDKRKNHTVRNSIAAAGIGAYLMNRFGRRGREDRRLEEVRERDEEAERIQRRNSLGRGGRYTGDNRHRRRDSFSETDVTPYGGSTPAASRHNLGGPAAAAAGVAAGAAAASGLHRGSRTNVLDSVHSAHDLTPPPPRPYGAVHDSSGSESYNTQRGGRRHRHHLSAAEAAAAAGVVGLAAGAAGATFAEHHRRRSSVGSPPLSLKMHTTDTNGGQRVTLRRLSPAEAAAEREAARRRDRRGRSGSANSLSGGAGGTNEGDRWRRVEARERAEAADMTAGPGGAPLEEGGRHYIPPGSIPPPPPVMHSSSPPYELPRPPPVPGSVTGTSAAYDTGGSAAGGRADDNRRRRRAERARRAEQGKGDGSGNRVNFT